MDSIAKISRPVYGTMDLPRIFRKYTKGALGIPPPAPFVSEFYLMF